MPNVGSWEYINNLEEQERIRRLTELTIHKEIPSDEEIISDIVLFREARERKRNLKIVHELEENERAWRLRWALCKYYKLRTRNMEEWMKTHGGYQGKKKESTASPSVESKLSITIVIEAEEEERQRRINEDKQLEEEAERERKKAFEITKKAEEEERQRRISLLEKHNQASQGLNAESERLRSTETRSGEEKTRE